MADTIICDSDYEQEIIVQDDTGAAQDISAWTFECLFKKADGRSNCLTLNMGNGITLTDPTAGTLSLSLTAAQTKQFGAGNARVMLWRTDSSNRKVIGEGTASFEDRNFDA